jgi:ribosomal protein L40E
MSFFKKFKDRVTKPTATVSLELANYSFTWGDKLEGKLTVSSEEEFDATEIRAELLCLEKKKETSRGLTFSTGSQGTSGGLEKSTEWNTAIIFARKLQASGPIHLSAGYHGEFPFSTNVAGGLPSYSGDDRTVTWTVKGVIGIKGRPDVTSQALGIQVTGAPTTITTEKIVEREVVMIPCQYCGSLFPQTATTCPKCGAQRKA